jgi:hypothetical protein
MDEITEDEIILLAICQKCNKFILKKDYATLECKCRIPYHKECIKDLKKCPECGVESDVRERVINKMTYYCVMFLITATLVGGLMGSLIFAAVTKS